DRTAAHRKLDQRRVRLCAGGLGKRGSPIASALDIQSFCHCIVERKRGRMHRMNPRKAIFLILVTASASLALADDFKTVNGKEYKDATVNRVEPDGIVIKTESGISKIYFAELPKAVQERFHYDAPKAVSSAAPQPQVVCVEYLDKMGRVTA